MKKKILALILATLMALSAVQVFADSPAEIAPEFTAIYGSLGVEPDYAAPISRARFSTLAFEAFRTLNNGVFPQMEAKNIFTDLGDAPEDMFVVMLYGMGVVNGVGNNTFAPRKAITRQEACTILVRAKLLQNPDSLSEIQTASAALDGVAGAEIIASWAKDSVAYLYSTGALGLKDGSLAPEAELTTEEAMLLCTAFIGA